ncbi:MAG: hypothetical protein QNJ78_08150 [Gammaproteobacteria bacterium]|nr:hypothetical protein [Gammaproteobacteria bacterium]
MSSEKTRPLFPLLSVIGWILVSSSLNAQEMAIPGFQELLIEAGLELSVPEGFQEVELEKNPLLQHEKAVRSQDGRLELRYVIRPLSRIEIDYSDPHSAMPEPNHMFNMLFHTIIGNLTKRGSRSPTKEYSQTQAKEFFNADWAAVGVFDVVSEYTDRYSQVMMLALHKNDIADAYTVFLFNDYDQVKPAVQQSMSSLKFTE